MKHTQSSGDERDIQAGVTASGEAINARETRPTTRPAGAVSSGSRRLLRTLGGIGVAMTIPGVAWVLLGLFDPVPSMTDVFGIDGLRIPASVTVCGLLMAAIGFYED